MIHDRPYDYGPPGVNRLGPQLKSLVVRDGFRTVALLGIGIPFASSPDAPPGNADVDVDGRVGVRVSHGPHVVFSLRRAPRNRDGTKCARPNSDPALHPTWPPPKGMLSVHREPNS